MCGHTLLWCRWCTARGCVAACVEALSWVWKMHASTPTYAPFPQPNARLEQCLEMQVHRIVAAHPTQVATLLQHHSQAVTLAHMLHHRGRRNTHQQAKPRSRLASQAKRDTALPVGTLPPEPFCLFLLTSSQPDTQINTQHTKWITCLQLPQCQVQSGPLINKGQVVGTRWTYPRESAPQVNTPGPWWMAKPLSGCGCTVSLQSL